VGETAGTLSNFINVEVSGGNTTLHLSSQGSFTGGVYNSAVANQHIVLEGVTLTGTTNQDKLNQLLSSGQLVIG